VPPLASIGGHRVSGEIDRAITQEAVKAAASLDSGCQRAASAFTPTERTSPLLTPFIDLYIREHRPKLMGPNGTAGALWISSRYRARITDEYVGRLIGATTLSTIGVRVNSHLFRTSAASAAAIYGGESYYLGSAILNHSDPRVTLEHYNRATSLSAAESLRQIIRQYEKVTSRSAI
jgi:hypothetical protein